MSRPLRVNAPGLFHHVMARGNNKMDIFLDDKDREKFLEILENVLVRYTLLCLAYCLMRNHYHLVLRTALPNLSAAIRQLNGVYAQWWNFRHRRVGHVTQGRFKAQIIQEEGYLLQVCRYVALNPVRAGLVTSPRDWRWSSYAATIGAAPAPPLVDSAPLLAHFDADGEEARTLYAGFVEDSCQAPDSVGEALRSDARVIGTTEFVKSLAPRAARASREVPRRERQLGRPSLHSLFVAGASAMGMVEAIREAHHTHGYLFEEIAAHLNTTERTVRRLARLGWSDVAGVS